jgi:2,3-bisphosphoglycerate-dependent phosphoglycerate mutase
MQVFWLVRHGESTWNVRGLAQGHCDQARLTDRGRRQARGVADQLKTRPIRTLFSSDLHRALETAVPLASAIGLPVIRDTRLRERCLGVLEGSAAAAISPAVSGISANRVVDPDARPDGGESLRDFYLRVACFTADLAGNVGDVAVVAHGGTLRMLDACLRGIGVGQMTWPPLANGRVLRSPPPRPAHLRNPYERNTP